MNSIAPGGVKTDMAAESGFKYIPTADASWSIEDIENFVASKTPMQRMASPVDIARVVGFLASEDAAWVSGESTSKPNHSNELFVQREADTNIGQNLTISGGASG